jgi:peroxiredoxin (alkyl hydroperoxide reductase subunit C)
MSNRVLGIGNEFPAFEKKAVVSIEYAQEFGVVNHLKHREEGKWLLLFWWPKDFTFVCPTEIASFNDYFDAFQEKNTQVIGASTDSEYVHLAWRKSHPDLKGLRFPMLADTSKSLAEELGILEANEKVAYRATFIVDPEGIIRWVSVNDLSVGRNVEEVIRVLDALQTGDLTPCNWKKGEDTLN